MSHAHPIPPPRQQGGLPAGVQLPEYPPEAEWLYHFSEDPNITEFVPRPVRSNTDSEPLVWTIDDTHSWLYFFPRECPRVAYWALPTTTPEDRERYFSQTAARNVVLIESAWLERLQTTTIYRYAFPSDTFLALRDHGCHVSRATLKPHSVKAIPNLLAALTERDVELRITPSLWPIWGPIIHSTVHFSGIRLRNATPPPEPAATV